MEWIGTFFYIFKIAIFLTGMSLAVKWHYDRDKAQRHEPGAQQSSSELRLFLAMIIVCGMSFIGIVYAACWGDASEGGSGGAIGCALTFGMSLLSLLSKPTADTILSDPRGQASQGPGNRLPAADRATQIEGRDQIPDVESQTERLRAAFAARLASAEREKVYLGVAGFVSALAWKFGPIPAAWLDFRH